MNPKNLAFTIAAILLFLHGLSISSPSQSSPREFHEVHVIRSLRQIHHAQTTYVATVGGGSYASLQTLRQAGLIDDALATGNKYGYVYVVSTTTGPPQFSVTATPRAYKKSGRRSFFIDRGGEIHGGDKQGELANRNDPIIDDCTSGSVMDNERCTILDMRALHGAETAYAATYGNGNYAPFRELYLAGLLRSDLEDYLTRGYSYKVLGINQAPNVPASYKIWATPVQYGTSAILSFYIYQTVTLRGAYKNGAPADHTDPPINKL